MLVCGVACADNCGGCSTCHGHGLPWVCWPMHASLCFCASRRRPVVVVAVVPVVRRGAVRHCRPKLACRACLTRTRPRLSAHATTNASPAGPAESQAGCAQGPSSRRARGSYSAPSTRGASYQLTPGPHVASGIHWSSAQQRGGGGPGDDRRSGRCGSGGGCCGASGCASGCGGGRGDGNNDCYGTWPRRGGKSRCGGKWRCTAHLSAEAARDAVTAVAVKATVVDPRVAHATLVLEHGNQGGVAVIDGAAATTD